MAPALSLIRITIAQPLAVLAVLVGVSVMAALNWSLLLTGVVRSRAYKARDIVMVIIWMISL